MSVPLYNNLEPSFCPLHCKVIPCLECLIPQVAHMVEDSHKGFSMLHTDTSWGLLFQEPSFDQN